MAYSWWIEFRKPDGYCFWAAVLASMCLQCAASAYWSKRIASKLCEACSIAALSLVISWMASPVIRNWAAMHKVLTQPNARFFLLICRINNPWMRRRVDGWVREGTILGGLLKPPCGARANQVVAALHLDVDAFWSEGINSQRGKSNQKCVTTSILQFDANWRSNSYGVGGSAFNQIASTMDRASPTYEIQRYSKAPRRLRWDLRQGTVQIKSRWHWRHGPRVIPLIAY